MVTKAIIRSINGNGTRCIVRMPLFETASSSAPVEAEALVNIVPGMFNNLVVGDVVFIAFEENALEKPIIIGKLFTGAANENKVLGGAGIVDSLLVRTAATIPSSTLYEFPANIKNEYKDLKTPKKVADYIKWLETLTKKAISTLYNHFVCFKNWTQFQLQPQNVEVDDGDLDTGHNVAQPFACQYEKTKCDICKRDCVNNKNRQYAEVDVNKSYPNL